MIVLSSDEYRGILDAFSSTPRIKISDYCVGYDKDPDTDKLQTDVASIIGKHLLIGLGDYLASKNDLAKKTLMSYKDLILQNNARIVILLSADMYQIAKEIYHSDPRSRTRIVLPKNAPTITTVSSNELVYGIKAYLETCEKGQSIGSVKTARNIQNATIINLESAFDELKHNFPHTFSKLTKNVGTTENWRTLLENTKKANKSIEQYLATKNFTALEHTFLDYAKRNDYEAWLYFVYLKLNTNSQSYLGYVVSECGVLNKLLTVAKNAILDIPVTDRRFKDFYEQRKVLFKNCSDVDMADFTRKMPLKGEDRIAYLTDITKVEKWAMIVALCDGAKDDSLSVNYPDLHLYMQTFIFEDSRFTKYFQEYKRYKLSNKIDEDFKRFVNEYSATRPYNSLPARSSLISRLDDGHTLLIFLDALGAEYLGYVTEKCAELSLRFKLSITRAELPTITSVNRIFYDEWNGKKKSIKDLDELKHDPECGYDYNNSPYPIHLAEELDVIKTALERAKIELETGGFRKVVIASDHGASRLAVISSDVQIPNNGCESKSSGRYCIGENLPTAHNIVIDGQYAVIADYSRFKGSRSASVEIHGGATLEEVIVPIIELTLLIDNVDVLLQNNVIEVSYKIDPILILMVTPDVDHITASVGENSYTVEKLEKSKFRVIMPDLKKGTYTLDVFEHQNKIASKEFTVKSKGLVERDIF